MVYQVYRHILHNHWQITDDLPVGRRVRLQLPEEYGSEIIRAVVVDHTINGYSILKPI